MAYRDRIRREEPGRRLNVTARTLGANLGLFSTRDTTNLSSLYISAARNHHACCHPLTVIVLVFTNR